MNTQWILVIDGRTSTLPAEVVEGMHTRGQSLTAAQRQRAWNIPQTLSLVAPEGATDAYRVLAELGIRATVAAGDIR